MPQVLSYRLFDLICRKIDVALRYLDQKFLEHCKPKGMMQDDPRYESLHVLLLTLQGPTFPAAWMSSVAGVNPYLTPGWLNLKKIVFTRFQEGDLGRWHPTKHADYTSRATASPFSLFLVILA